MNELSAVLPQRVLTDMSKQSLFHCVQRSTLFLPPVQ